MGQTTFLTAHIGFRHGQLLFHQAQGVRPPHQERPPPHGAARLPVLHPVLLRVQHGELLHSHHPPDGRDPPGREPDSHHSGGPVRVRLLPVLHHGDEDPQAGPADELPGSDDDGQPGGRAGPPGETHQHPGHSQQLLSRPSDHCGG